MKYHNGEIITAERIEDEDWYSDFQAVCEVLNTGPDSTVPMSFYERLPDGKEQAMTACKKYFDEFPGPVHKGWEPPDDERLSRWINSCWITEDQIQKIEAIRP